ncbi:MAG: substrate-binding domain-containing protein [Saprospiraceae bacterium]
MERIRIKDIAKLAGVSPGTVDRVIHNRGNVSEGAKQKVLGVMEKMGYEPNLLASTLALNRAIRLAIFLPDPALDIYWRQPLQGVEKAIRQITHYGVVPEFYFFDSNSEQDFLRKGQAVIQSNPNGVLLAPLIFKQGKVFIDRCIANKIPIININTEINAKGVLAYIGQDSFQSGILAARLISFNLIGTGHVLVLNMDNKLQDAKHLQEKEKGFRSYFNLNHSDQIHIYKLDIEDFNNQGYIIEKINSLPIPPKELSGIFVTNSRIYKLMECAGEIFGPKITTVGFDLIQPNIDYLNKDKISFLINQNSVQQGYLGIMGLTRHLLQKRKLEYLQNLPLDIVVKENINYYLKRAHELEILI